MLALNLKPNPLLAASSVGVCTDLSLLLALEHFDQRRSVDQRSATGVDQDCVPLHFRQTLGIYQVSRLGRHGACRDTTCLSASSSSSGTSGHGARWGSACGRWRSLCSQSRWRYRRPHDRSSQGRRSRRYAVFSRVPTKPSTLKFASSRAQHQRPPGPPADLKPRSTPGITREPSENLDRWLLSGLLFRTFGSGCGTQSRDFLGGKPGIRMQQ